jgi:hypothetical protein
MDPRYEMEHTVLPSLLFQQTQDLIAVAGAHGVRFFSDSYRAYFNGQGAECPYGEEAFSLHRREEAGAAVWILSLPQPQAPGHCRTLFLGFRADGSAMDFCAEELGADGVYYLIRIDAGDRRVILGAAQDAAKGIPELMLGGTLGRK